MDLGKNSNITDLCNLKFFSDSGTEIYAEKQYVITWKLITDHKSLYQVPEGYIMGDIEYAEHISRKTGDLLHQYYRLRPDSLVIGFTKLPKIIIPPSNNGINSQGIDYTSDNESRIIQRILNILLRTSKRQRSLVEITVHTNSGDYSVTVDTALFFDLEGLTFDNIQDEIIYTGSNDADDIKNNSEYTRIFTINKINLATILDQTDTSGKLQHFGTWDEIKSPDYTEFSETRKPHPYIYYLFDPDERGILLPKETGELSPGELYNNNAYVDPYENRKFTSKLQGIALMFPFVRYHGAFMQEETAVGFIAANTIIVLEECKAPNGEIYYERPALGGDAGWILSFECPEDGELKLIETTENNDIKQINNVSYHLTKFDSDTNTNIGGYIQPISFAIGVVGDTEGCYQNYLGIYIRYQNEMDIPFFMGMLTIKTEIIGEDERYRTLLENFGIPDPVNYTKAFYNTEYEEALPDYRVINEKSKELMLTYDQIFPYAGTYKALINALQFLGYTDIIIKEWYKFFDTTGRERDVAFDAVDIHANRLAELMYKKFNINVNTDSNNISKLNWLSLVYHINETVEPDGGFEKIDAWLVDNESLQVLSEYPLYLDGYYTQPIYAYRTTEITAKLHYLKRWLEAYIIGVNARIIDITGEGVFYSPMKTKIYGTGGLVLNFEMMEHATPKVLSISPFENSTANIECTLAELNNIRIKDLEGKTFGFYTQTTIDEDVMDQHIHLNISNPLEAAVFGDEYQFVFKVTPESGTLYQPGVKDPLYNGIIIKNNNIDFLNSNSTEVELAEPLPVITIQTGNIRNLIGRWERNVEWLIQETPDNTVKRYYKLKNIGTYDGYPDEVLSESHIQLFPVYKWHKEVQRVDEYNCPVLDDNGEPIFDTVEYDVLPEMKYTTNNKWRAPMLLIKGYKFMVDYNKYKVHPSYFDIPDDQWYILEIILGKISFYDNSEAVLDPDNPLKNISELTTDIVFEPTYDVEHGNKYYQSIKVQYSYTTIRSPFKTIQLNDKVDTTGEVTNGLHTLIVDISNDKELTALTEEVTDDDVILFAMQCANYKIPDKYSDTFLKKPEVIQHYRLFLENKRKCDIKNYITSKAQELYRASYTPYKSIATPVNHLGDYNITVKMYDRYNNQYTNIKETEVATVSAQPVKFSIYMNQEYSNNAEDFCKHNTTGKQTLAYTTAKLENNRVVTVQHPASEKVLLMLTEDWDYIKFPNTYDIYDIQNNTTDRDHLYYYNYTYAMPVPEEGDTLVLSNHAVEIKSITYNKEYDVTIIDLYDFDSKNERLLMEGQDIMLAVYDKKNIQEIGTYGPYKIASKENYIKIDYVKEVDSVYELINEDTWRKDFDKYRGKDNVIVHVKQTEKGIDAYYKLLNNTADSKMPYIIMSNWEQLNPIRDHEGTIMIPGKFNSMIPINTHMYLINVTEYDLTLDEIYQSESGYYNEFTIPSEVNKLHFAVNDVIKVNYMCNEIKYDTIDFTYTEHSKLHNALYDPLYPVLLITYDNNCIEPIEHQYHKGKEDEIRNIDLKFENAYQIDKILLVEFQYTDDTVLSPTTNYRDGIWTVTNLKEYLFNQENPSVLSYHDVIEPILNGQSDTVEYIERSQDVTFSKLERKVFVKFASETIENALFNSVAYRIIDVIADKKFIRNKGMLTHYRYVLDMPIDVWFMQKYQNSYLYNLSVKVMYPYSEQVHYHAQVLSMGEEHDVQFGTYGYSLIETNFKYDANNMFLDNYIDNNFIGRLYKYDPNTLRELAVYSYTEGNTLTYRNADVYTFKEIPVTIPQYRVIMLSPDLEKQFNHDDLLTYEWEWKHLVFDSPDDINENTNTRFRKETLFICNNKTICLRPESLGSNDIKLSVTDHYGNTLVNNSTGRIFVKS